MNGTRIDRLPGAVREGLQKLEAVTASSRYSPWKPGTARLQDRLEAAAAWLDAKQLDGDALFVLASTVVYVHDEMWKRLWATAGGALNERFGELGLALERARFIEPLGENLTAS